MTLLQLFPRFLHFLRFTTIRGSVLALCSFAFSDDREHPEPTRSRSFGANGRKGLYGRRIDSCVGTKNIHCGIPAADLEQSREVTDSLSGQCTYLSYLCSNVERERVPATTDSDAPTVEDV